MDTWINDMNVCWLIGIEYYAEDVPRNCGRGRASMER